MKKIGIVFIPLAIVLSAIGLYTFTGEHFDLSSQSRFSRSLKEGHYYAVWISHAEVAPTEKNGGAWDLDGSAPDLSGAIIWRGNVVLRTGIAHDSLIGQWEPVGFDLHRALFEGEVGPGSAAKFATIRFAEGEEIEIQLSDRDAVGADAVARFRVAMAELVVGRNLVINDRPDALLLRLGIVVSMEVSAAALLAKASGQGDGSPDAGKPIDVEWLENGRATGTWDEFMRSLEDESHSNAEELEEQLKKLYKKGQAAMGELTK